MPTFFVGIAFARIGRGQSGPWLASAMLLVATIGLLAGLPEKVPAVLCLVLVTGIFTVVRQARISAPSFVAAGSISYSLYLYHATLGFPLLELIKQLGLVEFWPLAAISILGLVLAVSCISYRFIEVTFVRAADRLIKSPRRQEFDARLPPDQSLVR